MHVDKIPTVVCFIELQLNEPPYVYENDPKALETKKNGRAE